MNLCSFDYQDLRIFLEGELLLGRRLFLEEIRYGQMNCYPSEKETIRLGKEASIFSFG